MYAQVIVDIAHANVDKCFTYDIAPDTDICPGQHVLVPFGRGNHTIEGFVLETTEQVPQDGYEIKRILRAIEPYPVLSAEQLQLAYWIQKSYNCLLVDALRLMIPAQMRGGRVREKTLRTVQLAPNIDREALRAQMLKKDGTPRSPRQYEVFELLEKVNAQMSVADICAYIPNAAAAITALKNKGVLVESGSVTFRSPFSDTALPQKQTHTHTAAQNAAIAAIEESFSQGAQTYLLHGVTGSGKTEVYLQCISDCLARGKQAIVLVPEIALTPQTVGRFRSWFGDEVAVLHSRLSPGERFDEWRRIRLGKAKVAVGARSAVFAPFENLGLIVIDEEHEQSYYSEHQPRYHAIDVARRRCAFSNAALVLGSATPSLTTYYRAKAGQYTLLELPERVEKRPMPKVEVVDMREEFLAGNNGIFSTKLRTALERCFRAGKQAILFMNRRGYSTFVSCRGCGYVFDCPDCDVAMTYHKSENAIKCHYCGRTMSLPSKCPVCGKSYIKYFGVGTQQVEEQLYKWFPHVRAMRMDMDSTRTKNAHEEMLGAFARGEAQVLIGTQMIAKGLDFPNVTLVGVVMADASLHIPDYRSAERSFQLLMQVAGRAGRDKDPGHVVIQTYSPAHPAISFARQHNYAGFYAYEIAQRRAALYPPFSLFVRTLFASENAEAVAAETESFREGLEARLREVLGEAHEDEILYIHAAQAPIRWKQGIFRYQVLLKLLRTRHTADVLRAVYAFTDENRSPGFVSLEINPTDMF